jgi:hypothetical protein
MLTSMFRKAMAMIKDIFTGGSSTTTTWTDIMTGGGSSPSTFFTDILDGGSS